MQNVSEKLGTHFAILHVISGLFSLVMIVIYKLQRYILKAEVSEKLKIS